MNVDLFAGAGGWEAAMPVAFQRNTFGVELDKDARATREANGLATWGLGDVSAYATRTLECVRPDTLIASPPCTAFSAAGKGHGRDHTDQLCDAIRRHDWQCRPHDDPNVWLALEVGRWAQALEPRAVVCEQVPSVLPLWEAYCEVLRGWGYSAWCGVLSSERWGVPQTRRRAILIARRDAPAAPPAPTHQAYEPGVPAGASVECEPSMFGPGLLPWVSMAEALGWGMTERPGLTFDPGTLAGGPDIVGGSGARAALAAERARGAWTVVNTRGDRSTPGGNEFMADRPSWALTEKARSWTLRERQANGAERDATEPAPTITASLDNGNMRWQLNRRQNGAPVVEADRPAPTVMAEGLAKGVWVWEGRCNPRITVAEAATLQSFPPGWKWRGSKTSQFRQVGNAIPPLLARAVLGAAGHPTEEES